MTSTTMHVPTSDDAVGSVLLIQEKIEAAHKLLVQLEEDASKLVELLIDHQPFLRFNTPLINAAGDVGRAIGERTDPVLVNCDRALALGVIEDFPGAR